MRAIALAALCASIAPGALGQWGLRLGVPHMESSTSRLDFNFILGLDADVGDRNGLGFEYNFSADLFGNAEEGESFEYDGQTGYYYLTRKCSGFTLRSMFFLNENDDGSVYLGPFIGIRNLSHELQTSYYDDYTGDMPAWAGRRTEETMLIPVGFRLGWRGPLDGYFGDIYIGIGQQMGDLDGTGAFYLTQKDQLRRFFLQFGYAMGVGWD